MGDNLNFVLHIHILYRTLYFVNCRSPKLALLHRAKEGKRPSLSNQAVFAPFPLKVAWSGISFIAPGAPKLELRQNQHLYSMSILRYGHILVTIFCNFHVDAKMVPCTMSILRNTLCRVTYFFTHVVRLHVETAKLPCQI